MVLLADFVIVVLPFVLSQGFGKVPAGALAHVVRMHDRPTSGYQDLAECLVVGVVAFQDFNF